jgi:hypothetical protein
MVEKLIMLVPQLVVVGMASACFCRNALIETAVEESVDCVLAVEAYASVGEISDVFRGLWGEYHDAR